VIVVKGFSGNGFKAMKFGMVPLAAAVLLALAGCNPFRGGLRTKSCHKPQPYMTAKSVAPLQIPPGLDTPDTTTALHIPRLAEPELPPRKGADPCLDEPPPYNIPKAVTPQA
jgi:uncharacterized lipoprotein